MKQVRRTSFVSLSLVDKAVRAGRIVAALKALRLVSGHWSTNQRYDNVKRVYRIWRREGLKVPMKQRKRGRLWLNDGSCVRLRPQRPNHVWSYDFVQDGTQDGRAFRMLVVLDEFTRRGAKADGTLDAMTHEVTAVTSQLPEPHTKTAHVQIVWGIGKALHEETLFDHRFGRIINANIAEYHVPVNAGVHDIEVIFVDEPDGLINPLGIKGLGEIGIVGAAAAIRQRGPPRDRPLAGVR